uniref:Glycine N-acyltransferase-like protein n=1 Tax=Crocodylus porosus TaxID=8502 RepID=A0A7M4FYS1_CROPO
MLILSCSSKLQLLEGVLRRGLPETLMVHGGLMNINRGNPGGYEVLVDSWPDFKAVLLRPRKEVGPVRCSVGTGRCGTGKRFRGFLFSDLASNQWHCTSLLPAGLQDGLYEASRDVAKAKGVQGERTSTLSPAALSRPSCPVALVLSLCFPRLDPAMKLSSLTASHVDLLNVTWAKGGNERSRRYLASLIRSFPSTCVLDATGCPISWNMTDQFGTMRHGYTLPEHRSHGYYSIVTIVTAKRLHAQGYPSFGHTSLDNYPMQRLQVNHGFRLLPSMSRFIIHHPTPGTVPS